MRAEEATEMARELLEGGDSPLESESNHGHEDF